MTHENAGQREFWGPGPRGRGRRWAGPPGMGMGMGPRRGRGRMRRGGEERVTAEQRQHINAWFIGRLPEGWFTGAPQVTVDADEILVVGQLPPVTIEGSAEDRAVAESARISGFREETREQRVRIADEAQAQFGRAVSWGAQ